MLISKVTNLVPLPLWYQEDQVIGCWRHCAEVIQGIDFQVYIRIFYQSLGSYWLGNILQLLRECMSGWWIHRMHTHCGSWSVCSVVWTAWCNGDVIIITSCILHLFRWPHLTNWRKSYKGYTGVTWFHHIKSLSLSMQYAVYLVTQCLHHRWCTLHFNPLIPFLQILRVLGVVICT